MRLPEALGRQVLERGGGRMILSSVLHAIGLFIATNIDDIIVLSLFFARGAVSAGPPPTSWSDRTLVHRHPGASVLVALGAGLPPEVIPYFAPFRWGWDFGLRGKPGVRCGR